MTSIGEDFIYLMHDYISQTGKVNRQLFIAEGEHTIDVLRVSAPVLY